TSSMYPASEKGRIQIYFPLKEVGLLHYGKQDRLVLLSLSFPDIPPPFPSIILTYILTAKNLLFLQVKYADGLQLLCPRS
ncbi:MAG: hypothetical protein J6E44_00260, partial [Lachnospiraceae bacterium]|nr:hypothetical protein [Lachnospiraceae bacterium]